jgi:hypothetical protein
LAVYKKGNAIKLSSNFKTTELDCKGTKCCSNTLIDKQLVIYLQKIRNHFNKPVIINSGYRCAVHNKAVGGARYSKHIQGKAADIVVKGVNPKEVAKYCEAIGIQGIGLYETFVHIDTRSKKSFWYSSNQSFISTFGGIRTNRQIAEEVIDGKWGTGADRRKRLTKAGYDYYEIQALVNDLLRK